MPLIKIFNIESLWRQSTRRQKKVQFVLNSYLLRSVVDTFEHLTKWTFSNSFLFCENELRVDFLQSGE